MSRHEVRVERFNGMSSGSATPFNGYILGNKCRYSAKVSRLHGATGRHRFHRSTMPRQADLRTVGRRTLRLQGARV